MKDPNETGMSFVATGQEARKEGCSCIYGNPCQDKYICNNWYMRTIRYTHDACSQFAHEHPSRLPAPTSTLPATHANFS